MKRVQVSFIGVLLVVVLIGFLVFQTSVVSPRDPSQQNRMPGQTQSIETLV